MENAAETLQKGITLLQSGFTKIQQESLPQEAGPLIRRIEAGLAEARTLLAQGLISEAADIAVKTGNLLDTFEPRVAIMHFRKSNDIQKNARDPKIIQLEHAQFFARGAKMLDKAELLLDQNETDEAKMLLHRYIREKMAAGLYSPML